MSFQYMYYYCCWKWCKKKTGESKEDPYYPRVFTKDVSVEPQKNPMHMSEQELFDYIIG
jgi:hypothetical protein